jgi:hypothetical protein
MELENSLLQSLWRPFFEAVKCPFFDVSLSPLTLRLLNQYFEYICQFSYSRHVFLDSVTITVFLSTNYDEASFFFSYLPILLSLSPSYIRVYFPQQYDGLYSYIFSNLIQILHGYLEERKTSVCHIASSPTPNPTLGKFVVFFVYEKIIVVMWPCALRTVEIHAKSQMEWASHLYVWFFILRYTHAQSNIRKICGIFVYEKIIVVMWPCALRTAEIDAKIR